MTPSSSGAGVPLSLPLRRELSGLGALRADLDRFTFLLGGNGGEHLLGHE